MLVLVYKIFAYRYLLKFLWIHFLLKMSKPMKEWCVEHIIKQD